ncbi:MAG: AAA family ATPase [Candidatus Parcubacteria bacterium]|nr:AAA family ATPase [Candidatus Parcubacteria bacterium]
MKNIILAIVGLPGAGKTEIINYLRQTQKWPNIYFGQAVFDELAQRGMEVNEQNERQIREELRSKYGMAAMAIKNIPKIKELYSQSSVLVESLYSWEEYLEMKKEFGDNFYVLAIYASPVTRIKRLNSRPERPLTKEQVESRDFSQIANLHQAGPIARADFTIINEGAKEAAFQQAEKFISLIK